MRHYRTVAPIVALIASAGCDTTSTPPAFVVRDSAGVRIVEHSADYTPPSWRLGDRPIVDIGSAGDDTLTSLFQVEGAHRLRDGRIVVANSGTHQLRFFDATGSYVNAVGREGEGPGEFGYLTWTAVCQADSIFTYDIGTRRLSVFDDHGAFVRSVLLQLPDGRGPYGAAACAPDGAFLFSGWPEYLRNPGPSRPSRPLFLIGSDGHALESFGEFPGGERYSYTNDGRVTGSGPRPLGRETHYVLGDGRFFLGTSDEYEIQVYNVTGELVMEIRRTEPDLAITPSHIDQFVSEQVSRTTTDNQRRSRERLYREMEFPETFPAYARLLLDEPGNLWVQDYVRPGEEAQMIWNVFGSDGGLIAAVSTPPGLHIYEIGEDYVLGKWQDELDVEHVRLYALVKPE